MSLILVRVKRSAAAYHANGRVHKTGEPFEMEESQFLDSVPGFFERIEPEQIKSKELPVQVHEPSAATPKVQEPEETQILDDEPAKSSISDPIVGKRKLKLKKE
jgi:hypothetical protein